MPKLKRGAPSRLRRPIASGGRHCDVNRAVEACGARIVVSSSWREAFPDAAAFAGATGLRPP